VATLGGFSVVRSPDVEQPGGEIHVALLERDDLALAQAPVDADRERTPPALGDAIEDGWDPLGLQVKRLALRHLALAHLARHRVRSVKTLCRPRGVDGSANIGAQVVHGGWPDLVGLGVKEVVDLPGRELRWRELGQGRGEDVAPDGPRTSLVRPRLCQPLGDPPLDEIAEGLVAIDERGLVEPLPDPSLLDLYLGVQPFRHGDVEEAGWYLTLEDARLSGAELLTGVVQRAGADRTHVIIDACDAYLLALPRGPGGTRRPMSGFVELEAASRAGRIGYLLSSSVSGESHEWAGFEAGVFSHEIRSGLCGAADANGDGQVTYAEIGAFVSRANEAIANQRFRPQVLARAPRDGDLWLDLRSRGDRQLRLDGPEGAAHYLLEDAQGVRLLDFHGTGTAPIHLVRPPGEGPLYLRRVADGLERTVPRTGGIVHMESLPAVAARWQTRGAAHHAFSQIFTLAFDDRAVATWDDHAAEVRSRLDAEEIARETQGASARRRHILGVTALAVGLAAAIAATAFELSAHALHDEAPLGESHAQAVARNAQIDARNHATLGLVIGAGGAAATGAVLLLWPKAAPAATALEIAASPAGTQIGARWRF